MPRRLLRSSGFNIKNLKLSDCEDLHENRFVILDGERYIYITDQEIMKEYAKMYYQRKKRR